MGIKKLPWKNIAWISFFVIFAGLVGIFGPVKDWNWLLGGIKDVLNFLFSPIGRDVILFLLIGFILFVIFIKRKSSPVSKEEFDGYRREVQGIEREIRESVAKIGKDLKGARETPKKHEDSDVKEEAIFILETVGARGSCQMVKDELYVAYERKFAPKFKNREETTLDFNMNFNWIKALGYVSEDMVEDDVDGFEELISIEDNGFKYLDRAKKKLAEEKKK